eukprot:6489038-Amphidinium_carterae.1
MPLMRHHTLGQDQVEHAKEQLVHKVRGMLVELHRDVICARTLAERAGGEGVTEFALCDVDVVVDVRIL